MLYCKDIVIFIFILILVNTVNGSCDIVALRENFVDRPESYDSFSAQSCVFLANGLGVYFSIPLHNLAPKQGIKNS
jgi:hypothetical protein